MEKKKISVKPFLRWAGGKRWFIKSIHSFLPERFGGYIEPFAGGGAVFCYLQASNRLGKPILLSDTNRELMNVYKRLKLSCEEIIEVVSSYKNTADFYYHMRDFQPENKVEQAARFIYLNQTSYNGIYRVNSSGLYNVPYGKRKGRLESYLNFDNLRRFSKALKNVTISHGDFELQVRNHIKEKFLVFLDPPYTVMHEHNGFLQYNQKIFSWDDQKRLALLLEHINNIGAFYIMTNAAHYSIENLFEQYGKKYIMTRSSLIGGIGAKRQPAHEYVFTNILR